MKLKATSLFLGICVAVLVVAACPGFARSTTGFNAARVWAPVGAYNCVKESVGAATNVCSSRIQLTFDAVVDDAGWHTITAWDSAPGYGYVDCQGLAFSPQSNSIYWGTHSTFPPSGQTSLNFSAYVYPGWSLSLYCGDVEPGRGIASLNWNP
jgi:hypothetical protein